MNISALQPTNIKTSNGITAVHFSFNGPAGKIEALLTAPETNNDFNAISVICHPHPLHGGTLTNKVVHIAAKAMNDLGVPALRFNFRGVGQSQGEHDNAVGEREDLLAAIEQIQQLYPRRELWLVGFSFGAYIALATAHQSKAKKLITIAPAIHLYDFNQIVLPNNDWLLIQGDADEIVPAKEAILWAEQLEHPPTIAVLHDAGHFFHGRLNELRDIIVKHINP